MVSHKTPTAVAKVACCCLELRMRRRRSRGGGELGGDMPLPMRPGGFGEHHELPGQSP